MFCSQLDEMTYDDTEAEDLNKKESISYAKFPVIFKPVPLLWNAKYILLTKTSVRIVSSKQTPTEECLFCFFVELFLHPKEEHCGLVKAV